MAERWAHSPVYSHGYLVPAFAVALLWFRREKLSSLVVHPNWLLGLPLLLAGVMLRLAGSCFYFPWFDEISLLVCLSGLCLLLTGWEVLKWCWPAIAFLFFMLPLPYRVEVGLRQPLQNLATVASTYALQTVGCPAFAEGNVILLLGVFPYPKPLGIEEACSGLSMLLIFFALSTAVALVINRPLWEKGLIVVSAIPIAIVANVARITATGMLYQIGQGRVAEMTFHDLAGWLMMPLGLALLWLEIKVLGQLFVVTKKGRVLPTPLVAPSFVAGYQSAKKVGKRRRRRST
jgi:exosortase